MSRSVFGWGQVTANQGHRVTASIGSPLRSPEIPAFGTGFGTSSLCRMLQSVVRSIGDPMIVGLPCGRARRPILQEFGVPACDVVMNRNSIDADTLQYMTVKRWVRRRICSDPGQHAEVGAECIWHARGTVVSYQLGLAKIEAPHSRQTSVGTGKHVNLGSCERVGAPILLIGIVQSRYVKAPARQ